MRIASFFLFGNFQINISFRTFTMLFFPWYLNRLLINECLSLQENSVKLFTTNSINIPLLCFCSFIFSPMMFSIEKLLDISMITIYLYSSFTHNFLIVVE